MKFLAIAILVLLSGSIGSAWAYRVIEQPEDAFELVLTDVVLPRTQTGFIRFRTCASCPRTSLRVTDDTTYHVNDSVMSFPDFTEAAITLRDTTDAEANTAVYVFHNIESGHVNRLMLDYLGR